MRKNLQYIVAEKRGKKRLNRRMEEILPRRCVRTLRLLAALILLITIQVILYNRRVYLQLNTSHSPAAKGVRELVIKPFREKKNLSSVFRLSKTIFKDIQITLEV